MTRVLTVILVLWIMAFAASCFDPEPGEISVRCFKGGRQQGCAVAVYNSSGAQIQLIPTDLNGLQYIKLPPGKYTLKFQSIDGDPYPAVVEVDLGANDSKVLTVNLEEGPATE